MRKRRREVSAVQHVASFLGVYCVTIRPPLVVDHGLYRTCREASSPQKNNRREMRQDFCGPLTPASLDRQNYRGDCRHRE